MILIPIYIFQQCLLCNQFIIRLRADTLPVYMHAVENKMYLLSLISYSLNFPLSLSCARIALLNIPVQDIRS